MNYEHPSIPDILLISLIGFLTVFMVLVMLMGIIMLISKIFGEKKPAPAGALSQSAPVAVETTEPYTGVKLNGVSDRDAALLMAIVADEIGKPLENLRFISIKEVNDDEI